MPLSRRRFVERAISTSTLGVLGQQALLPVARGARVEGYRPNLLPSQKEVWDWQVWMAKLGPKYTGNPAHTTFVEFLATQLQRTGLDVARERYSFPRWEARRWEITITPAVGTSFKAPVTSYFPYSGQTPAAGVTGEFVDAGHSPSFNLKGVHGKVALIDFATKGCKE